LGILVFKEILAQLVGMERRVLKAQLVQMERSEILELLGVVEILGLPE
jgi:DNA-binding HxlR family transcriptional regulator